MKTPIRFGIVGFGYIGNRHAEIIKGHPDCELLGICDVNAELRSLAKEKHGVPFYDSMESMMEAHPDAEVICICTPNGLHAEQATKALDADRHVVIEKPMGLKRASCEQVLFKSLQKDRRVFGVMQNRYSPPSAWLKEVVDKGILGDIRMVQVNCYWNRDDRYYKPGRWKGSLDMDGGVLFTQFSHFFDIMVWLFGDLTDITAKFENFSHRHSTEFEDSGFVSFRFLEGGMGTLNYSTSTWDKNFESSITILGEKGTIKVGGQYMEKVEYCHVENYTMPELPPSNPPNDYGPYKGSAANHHYIFENVVETLRGDGAITTNAMEGLKIVDIIERIYQQRDLSDFFGKK